MDAYVWEAVGRPMQLRDHTALAFSSNFVILVFSFMCLVLVTIYTANTTANITTTRLQSTITGIQDLPGKRVGTWTEYEVTLRKYGIVATGYPWESSDDEEAMVNALSSGEIQALVLDDSLMVYRGSSSCDLAVVGSTFENFDQAVALSPSFSSANPQLLGAINTAIVALKEDGILGQIQDQQVDPPDSECKNTPLASSEGSTKVSFSQVAGLWIMLAGGIAIALVLALMYKLHERYTQRHVSRLGTTMKRQMSRVVTRVRSGGKKRGTGGKSGRAGQLDTSGLDISVQSSVTASEMDYIVGGGGDKDNFTPASSADEELKSTFSV